MNWVYMTLGMCASAIAVGAAFLRVARRYVKHIVSETRAVGEQLRPNGGGSFRDHFDERMNLQDRRLTRIEWRQDSTDRRVSQMENHG